MYRFVQVLVSFLLGSYLLVVVFNNTSDYGTNFTFVQKVLSMEDTFRNGTEWRALTHPALPHVFYISIILAEAACVFFCLSGAYRMSRALSADAARFSEAKNRAVLGVLIGFCIWIGAFLTVGGEWFLMWQSDEWDAQDTALKLGCLYGLGLLILKD